MSAQHDYREIAAEHIVDILMALSRVASGDFDYHLDVKLSDDDPFHALFQGVNQTLAALQGAQQQTLDYQRELEDKLATIERQQAEIRELATPIIEVWDGVLCLPVVGSLEGTRGEEMTATVLEAISQRGATTVLIDITGMDAIDTNAAGHLVRLAQATQLVGAKCVLTGVGPAIAQTMVALDLGFGTVRTFKSLREGLKHHVASAFRRDAATYTGAT